MKALLTICFFLVLSSVSIGQTRTVTVTAVPNAKIWIDGVYRGEIGEKKTVTLTHVNKGIRKLTVRADGFKEFKGTISANQSAVTVNLVSTKDQGELLFQEAERLVGESTEEAILKYEEALKLSPRFVSAYIGLARAQSSSSDYSGALSTIKKLRAFDPRNSEASAIEGRIHKSLGDIDAALNAFERAIGEGKGFQPEAHTGIALILKEEAEKATGDAELEKLYYIDAAKSFETAIDQLQATEPVVYLFAGDIYEKLGDKQKAIAIYERFIRDMPDNPERSAVESFIVQLRRN